ncbi:MAG: SDR family oxidoreductase [Gammaproteobacteria bacterium]|nr:SDR family oxidoreductase [Gammaproteobacteria bacterium]
MAVVVITGSSSGFGLQAALAFARNGDSVIATMRNPEKSEVLRDLASQEDLRVDVLALDVTESGTFDEFFENVVEKYGAVDVLVNNAGILRPGAFEDLDEAEIRLVMETNFFGPMLLSKAVLPHMREQQSGHIIMVSSLSGIAGLPGDVAYTGSKFALEGASEALRHEVDRWNIKLSLIQAGMYSTQIFPDKGDDVMPEGYPADSPYRTLVETKLRGVYESLKGALDPKDIANLMVTIASSSGEQLRWPADAVAKMVLQKMFAQNDTERDDFLRGVSGSDWWSNGEVAPTAGESE